MCVFVCLFVRDGRQAGRQAGRRAGRQDRTSLVLHRGSGAMAESKIVFVTASVAGKSIAKNHFDKVSALTRSTPNLEFQHP